MSVYNAIHTKLVIHVGIWEDPLHVDGAVVLFKQIKKYSFKILFINIIIIKYS
jgi:hypothetical protein